MIAFIKANRELHGVEPICRVPQIAPSTFYERLAIERDPDRASDRAKRDAYLRKEMKDVWAKNRSIYGARKLWHAMKRERIEVARCTVERLMRQIGIQGVQRGKKVKTTHGQPADQCPLDKVNRQFRASMPNELWVSDFTFISTWRGFVYIAFVIDTFANRIVGWKAATTKDTQFVLDALEQAIHARRPAEKLIHHSDRGSQYVSIKYTKRLVDAGLEPSVAAIVSRTDGVHRRPSAIIMTMRWLRRSSAYSKPKSSIGWGRGSQKIMSNGKPCNGWTGSTRNACSSRSVTSCQSKPRRDTNKP